MDLSIAKVTHCYEVSSTITTSPTGPLYCYEILTTCAVSRTGNPAINPTLEPKSTYTNTTSIHTTNNQPNLTTSTNSSITSRLGLGDVALEFQQTNWVTGLLVTIAILVVVNWITITHRRVNLESWNHQLKLEIAKVRVQGVGSVDTELKLELEKVKAEIEGLKLETAKVSVHGVGLVDTELKLELEKVKAEIEGLKRETAKVRVLELELELERVRGRATPRSGRWVPYRDQSRSI